MAFNPVLPFHFLGSQINYNIIILLLAVQAKNPIKWLILIFFVWHCLYIYIGVLQEVCNIFWTVPKFILKGCCSVHISYNESFLVVCCCDVLRSQK